MVSMFEYRTIKEVNHKQILIHTAFYGRKSKELSHYPAEVFALIVCLFLLLSIRFILEQYSPPQDKP